MKLSDRQKADGWIPCPTQAAINAWFAIGGRWQVISTQATALQSPSFLTSPANATTRYYWRPVDPETWSWVVEWAWLCGLDAAKWFEVDDDRPPIAFVGRYVMRTLETWWECRVRVGQGLIDSGPSDNSRIAAESALRQHLAPWAKEQAA